MQRNLSLLALGKLVIVAEGTLQTFEKNVIKP